MTSVELGLKVIESYRIWAQWLVTLDFAAIGAIAYIYGFYHPNNNTGGTATSSKIPSGAKWLMAPFVISVLAASMVVGNLSSVVERFVVAQDSVAQHRSDSHVKEDQQEKKPGQAVIPIGDIKNMDLNDVLGKVGIPNPLWTISAIAGLSFTVGAWSLALAVVFRSPSKGGS